MRDLRHLTTAEDIFAAIVEHIELATNQGKIRPTISIFAPQKQVKRRNLVISMPKIYINFFRKDINFMSKKN